jgi:predicted phage terminase large subunit-like protein
LARINYTAEEWADVGSCGNRRLAPVDLSAFGQYVFGYKPAQHHLQWLKILADQSVRRFLIIAPPDHAKTTWVAIVYAAWRIGRDPTCHFGFISNTATQAYKPSVAVRDTIWQNPRYREIFRKVRPDFIKGWAEKEWFVKRKAPGDKDPSFVAAGVFGPILGGRMDELLFDDICDQENTATAHQREKLREWVKATAMTRVVPGGRVGAIMTRWHEKDIGAWFAEQGWLIIHMPMVGYGGKEKCPFCRKLPPEQTMHFEAGLDAPLWPERCGGAVVLDKRKTLGPLRFEGMCQGNPTVPQGTLLKRAWFRLEEQIPAAFDYVLQIWDTAYESEEEGAEKGSDASYSACITLGVRGADVTILGCFKRRMAWPELLRAGYTEFRLQGLRGQFPQLILVEDKASGKSLIQAWRSGQGRKQGDPLLPVMPVPARQSKTERANSVSGFIEAGHVHLPAGAPWAEALLDQCAAFPKAAHEDDVDALIHGLRFIFLGDEQKQEVVAEYEEQVVISPELDRADAGWGA